LGLKRAPHYSELDGSCTNGRIYGLGPPKNHRLCSSTAIIFSGLNYSRLGLKVSPRRHPCPLA